MKEYEMLAKKFASEETYCDSYYTARDAYEAGFLKAKEMAIEIALKWDMSDKYPNNLSSALEQLGENEIEPNDQK